MTERLRIAQLAPLASPVTPDGGGSIEQLVSLLTEELVRRGHEVTLFAPGDSRTSARLHALYPRGYEEDDDLWNWRLHESLHTAAAFERAGDFDVIHSHNYYFALPFTRLVSTPVVHTYHILPNADVVRCFARYPEARVVAVSEYQRQVFQGGPGVPVVYHGIDTDAFPFSPRRGDYLLYLGRVMPDKGPREAIGLARRAGMRLLLAGPAEPDYYHSAIAPLVDGREVEYVGGVGPAERNRLLAGAAALLYPLRQPEPFGLVLVEAMACGSPVAAVGLGAVPEVVADGVTGYHAADAEALLERLPAVLALDRGRVRQEAVRRFDYRRMVDGYLEVYWRLAGARRRWAV